MVAILALVVQSAAISVASFGAVGDGVANDTVAIQAAAREASRLGVSVYFPPGTYSVNTAVSMHSHATWTATPGTATLVAMNDNPILTAVETENITLSGLKLKGCPTATKPSALLIVYKSLGFSLQHVTFEDTTGIGALFSNVNDTTVSDSSFINIGNSPSNLSLSAQGVAFSNDMAGYGNANIVEHSHFQSIGLDAISATDQTGFQAISNVVMDSSINRGWAQQNAAAAGVYGNRDNELTVAGNTIERVSGNGIDINASSHVSIYQNKILGTGSAGIALYSATGGFIGWNSTLNNDELHHFQSQGGIVIGAQNASNIVVTGNISGNMGAATTQPYGIQVLDGNDLNTKNLRIATNNILEHNSIAAIYDPSSSYGLVAANGLPNLAFVPGINDAPAISGLIPETSDGKVKPFAHAVVSSADLGVTETVRVTVAGGNSSGALSGPKVVETSSPGTYVVGDAGITPATASALLQNVIFTPTAMNGSASPEASAQLTLTIVQTSPTSHSTVTTTATTMFGGAP